MSGSHPAAFDAFAATYDRDFSETKLGRLLRRRVWRVLRDAFPPGSYVLEMACGTGLDAAWLARRRVRVTATDGAQAMVDATRRRIVSSGLEDMVNVRRQSLQELAEVQWPATPPFDGAFSNFGGLNTLPTWSPLAYSLARAVRPSGKLVLVPMGPVCPWEIVWYMAHGQPQVAWRRIRQPATARIGDASIAVWYPRLKELKRAMAPWFEHRTTRSLGLWLPPSYLSHLVERHATIFRALDRLEQLTARLSGSWGDHYVACFERTSTPANRSVMRAPSRGGG